MGTVFSTNPNPLIATSRLSSPKPSRTAQYIFSQNFGEHRFVFIGRFHEKPQARRISFSSQSHERRAGTQSNSHFQRVRAAGGSFLLPQAGFHTSTTRSAASYCTGEYSRPFPKFPSAFFGFSSFNYLCCPSWPPLPNLGFHFFFLV